MSGPRPLLVGQAPGPRGDGHPSFDADRAGSGRRLARILGLEPATDAELRRWVDAVNLLDHYPGKAGKGDAFPPRAARYAAIRLLQEQPSGRTLILVGRGVARAFGYGAALPLSVFSAGDRVIALIPHPSGVNRWYNDPLNVEAARNVLRRLVGLATYHEDK